MLRPALAATAALALAFAALVAPATIAPVAPASAAASGSGLLFETGGATCASGIATPCRAAIEYRTSSYGPTGPGDTNIKRRTLFSVYAVAGEQILMGSSSIGVGSADAVVWNPGLISETGVNTVANADLPSPSFTCSAQRGMSGNGTRGVLNTRLKEVRGPQSIDGSGNTDGYRPCYYTAPTTGIYRVAFYGTAGGQSDSQGSPDPAVAPAGGFDNPAGSTSILAWDITVRPAALDSTTNRTGRVYTYSFALFTGDNPRPVVATMYLNTTDGFRYRVNTRGLDGNGFAYYGNRVGFLDADGTPLNRDVLGTGGSAQNLTTLKGGTRLAAPEYPISLERLAPETLAALSIPVAPTDPVLNSVTYAGKKTASGSYVNQGGTFTVDTGTGGTYEIVLSRDGPNFDPGLPVNATIRGVVDAAGVYSVEWDGKDNSDSEFPVGDDYSVHATLRGGEYHAPMLDIESSYYGGPTITLVNPPNGICPFTGATSDTTNCTTAFFDDRGYTASSGVNVGTPGGQLCTNFVGDVPDPLFSDPVTGFDSAGTDRAFGTTTKNNANAECPATNGTLGDAKGLDIWTFFPSAVQSTQADVLPLPTSPDALADADTTSVGTPVTRDAASGVLTNDVGTNLTVTANTAPASGTLVINADGSYTYTPTGSFTGTVTSTYTVRDDAGQTDTAVLTITVTPRATNDTATTSAETVVTRDAATGVLANDAGSGLTVTGDTGIPSGTGALTLNANGSYSYTPADDFSGTVSTTYTIRDGNGQTATATLTITVTPVAVDDSDTTSAGVTLTRAAGAGVLADDLGSGLTVTDFTAPSSGTLDIAGDGSYEFGPAAGFSGTVTSTYTVEDANGQLMTATLTITVTPRAVDDTDVTTAGTAIARTDGELLANDLGTGLVVSSSSPAPTGAGTLTIGSDGDYSYTPATGYSGTFSVDYLITDTSSATDTGTLTITVTPRAIDDTDATSAGTAISRDAAAGVLPDDLGTDLEVSEHTALAAGEGTLTIAADGSYAFTPAAGFSGDAVSSYTVEDAAGGTATATLTITVTPVAVDDADATTAGTAISRDLASGVLADDLGSGLTVTDFSAPSSGTLNIAADGSYTYTPAAGFSGDVSSTYTITDASSRSTTAVLSIRVDPLAVDDSASTPFGAALTRDTATGVLGNDRGAGLTVTDYDAVSPARGVLTLDNDGAYSFVPADGYSGIVTTLYTITDGAGRTDTAALTIAVGLAAIDDTDTTTVDAPITRDAANGVLPDDGGTGLEVTHFTAPAAGTLNITGDGAYSYTPATGFSGIVTSTYTVTDDDGQTDTAVLTITVTPVAVNDTDATPAGTSISRGAAAGVLADDRGSNLTVAEFTDPASGTLDIATDGSYSYSPAAGFSGVVSSVYTLEDADGQTTTATLTITVAPVAVDDTDTTIVNTILLRLSGSGVLANDLGTGLTASFVSGPPSTQFVLGSDGSYVYTPPTDFTGQVVVTYLITDAIGQTDTATLTINVTPSATNDADATTAGTAIARDAAAGVLPDDHGTGLTVTDFTAPASGTLAIDADGSYDYTPATGYSGTVVSTYTVTDSSGQTATATLTITVTPVAVDDADATVAETPLSRDAAAGVLADDLGSALTVTARTAPASGTLTIDADGSYDYTPAPGFSGVVTSTYTVRDASAQTTTATLTITVTPLTVDDTDATTAGAPVSRDAASGVLSDDRGTNLTVTGFTAPASGTLAIAADGAYVYTPAVGFSGTVASTYTVEDASGQVATGVLTITVLPVAVDDSDDTVVDTSITRDAANGVLPDDLGTGLTVTAHTAAAHGLITIASDGSYSYTPDAGFSGTDTVVYTVRDTSAQTTTATLMITVSPVGGVDVATTPADTVLNVPASGVLGNDAGSTLVVSTHTQPGDGSVVVNADGSYRYTPPAGFSGVTSFSYTASDGTGSYTQTVTVTVTPVAVDDTADGDVDGEIVLTPTELLGDDLGTTLAVTGGTDGAHGTVVVAPDGTVTYTPEPGFSGQDTFTYTITGAGGTATATVTLLVRQSAPDDAVRTRVDETVDSVTGRLLSAARGTGLSVARYTPTSHGTVVVDADGTFHYTPNTGYVGADSFSYTLVDAFGTEVTGTVSIDVVPQLPDTGVDARVWSLGALFVLLLGLAFAAAARARRRLLS
jgi:hypothetical protein